MSARQGSNRCSQACRGQGDVSFVEHRGRRPTLTLTLIEDGQGRVPNARQWFLSGGLTAFVTEQQRASDRPAMQPARGWMHCTWSPVPHICSISCAPQTISVDVVSCRVSKFPARDQPEVAFKQVVSASATAFDQTLLVCPPVQGCRLPKLAAHETAGSPINDWTAPAQLRRTFRLPR